MRVKQPAALALALALALAWVCPTSALASPFSVPLISAPSAEAQSGDSDAPAMIEAKAAYEAGGNAYALGKYEEAVSQFERAYELSHEPALLFNLGQAYTRWYDLSDDVEHLKKARRLYENYVLNVDGTALDEAGRAEARADAQHRIKEVDRRIAAHEEKRASQPGPDQVEGKRPLHKKAWFWVVVIGGLAAVAGVTTAVVLATRPDAAFDAELGTIGAATSSQPGGFTLRF